MKRPDNWAIRHVLDNYAAMYYENEDKYMAGDINFSQYDDIKEKNVKTAIQAMRLVFTNNNYSFGDLMPVECFIDSVISGYFTSWDGTGYYVDFDGNELGYVNWDDPEDYPEDTVFVAWYNK